MRRVAAGVVVGVAVWLGSALAAEAQIDITPTGPTAVYDTDTSSTYTATVYCSKSFYFRLKVYLNGILKHDSTRFIVNSGPVYYFAKVVDMTGWGHQAGDTLIYRGRARIWASGIFDEEDWVVTVSHETTHLVPGRNTRHLEWDREREEWA